MKCNKCKKVVPKGQKFCENCGSPVKKKSAIGVILIIWLLLLCVLGGFGAYYVLNTKDKEDDQKVERKKEEKEDDQKTSDKKDDASDKKEEAKEEKEEEPVVEEPSSNIDFELVCKNGMESCVITCYDADQNVLWKKEPQAVEMTELEQFVEIGVYNDLYYYVDAAHVTALDLTTGQQKWQETYYNVCPCESAFDFDDNGNLCIAGYYGPDFLVLSKTGEILCAIEEFSDDYWWPTTITVADNQATVHMDGSFDDNGGDVIVNLSDYSYAVGSAGAARIVSAVASSVLNNDNANYGSANIFDGNMDTAWVEGADGNGVGESIRIYFDTETTIHCMDIYNGYQKSEDLYFKNARATALDLSFSDGTTQRVYVSSDQVGLESVTFYSTLTSYVDIKVVSAASGSKYSDLCISEVTFR